MRTAITYLALIASGRPIFISFLTSVDALPVGPNASPTSLSTNATYPLLTTNIPPPSLPVSEAKHIRFLSPAIIVSFILFVTFTASLITFFFFGPQILALLRQKQERQKEHEPEPEEEPALGFGFEGLTDAQLEVARWTEEKQAMRPKLFIKLPVSPPSLVLKHHSEAPLSPIRAYASVEGEDIKALLPTDDPVDGSLPPSPSILSLVSTAEGPAMSSLPFQPTDSTAQKVQEDEKKHSMVDGSEPPQ